MAISPKQIQEAVEVLRNGGVVVFPTETAYGLAADATNSEAVDRVSILKEREEGKTFSLIAADRIMVDRYAGISRFIEKFISKYWPGPLTLVLPVLGDELALGVIRNGEIAVRVSSHPVAQALSEGLGAPIVSTSANVGGQPAGYTIEAIRAQFNGHEHQPDMYLDGGELDNRMKPSTIVTVDDYGYPEVIRDGAIDLGL
jgi:L-threonylcarbamoyladenylate synthase